MVITLIRRMAVHEPTEAHPGYASNQSWRLDQRTARGHQGRRRPHVARFRHQDATQRTRDED